MNELEVSPAHAVAGVLPLEEPFRRVMALAEALRRTHREGAVYGSLDPSHILWEGSGASLQQNGAGGLTPYVSPEQVRGETADARSDIFSFGAVAYELFSGHRAFLAEEPGELKKQILEHTPPPLGAIPQQISRLISRCLEKNPANRWQRFNPILIELKLAHGAIRQAQAAADWKERVATLRAQIAGHDDRIAAQQAMQQQLDSEHRQSIQALQDSLAAVNETIAALRKVDEINAKAIEGLEVAASQTDEVVEHVVEAFGMLHQAVGERGEAKVLLVPRNGG